MRLLRNKKGRDVEKKVFQIERFDAPIHLYIEKRNGSRISLLKDKINIRIPKHYTKKHQQDEFKKLLNWAEQRLRKKNIYTASSQHKDYFTEKGITIYGKSWNIIYTYKDIDRIKVMLDGTAGAIELFGPWKEMNKSQINKESKQMLITILKKYLQPHLRNLVSQINNETLAERYNKVTLKYINSRWGSCSAKRNINLSIRLLFAPKDVIRYVIVHELCHLVHLNHSAQFWSLVESHSPNYKHHESWLNNNGHLCDF